MENAIISNVFARKDGKGKSVIEKVVNLSAKMGDIALMESVPVLPDSKGILVLKKSALTTVLVFFFFLYKIGNGVCKNSTCICNEAYSGIDCSLKECPGNLGKEKCFGRGKCNSTSGEVKIFLNYLNIRAFIYIKIHQLF